MTSLQEAAIRAVDLEMVSRDSKVVLEDIRSIILQEMQMIFSEICLKISSTEAAVKAQMVSEVMVFTEAVSMTMDPDLVASEDLAVTDQQALINASVSVTFDEAAFGCDKRITLQDQSGKAQTLEVHIPAGIDSGKSIRLRGKGMPGTGKGGAGDLLLKVTVQPKAGYERKGMDVYTTVSIPYTTAVFGGEARVHTLYGDVMCKIKEGTQSGSKIRLRGKGIVSMKDANVHGDQYVTVQIQVPRHLNAEARQKLMEYKKAAAGGR